MRQLRIAFFAEGSTDNAFLPTVLEKSVNYCVDVYGTCPIDILGVDEISLHGGTFVDKGLNACQQALEHGAELLVVHTDADSATAGKAWAERIQPLLDAVAQADANTHCQVVVPAVPVQMIEAWMMADTALLREQMGTAKSDADLGLNRKPEAYADPKQAIENAIAIVGQDTTKRRRHRLTIGDLYEPLGQQLDIEDLMPLPSFSEFLSGLHAALCQLHICHP